MSPQSTPSRASPLPLWLCVATLTGCVSRLFPIRDDFSDETPRRALNLTIDRMEQAYSFTRHKGLDWDDIRVRLDTEMHAAATQDDVDRVFGMLVSAVPDGHVILENEVPDRELCAEATHTLGLQLRQTDDGDVVVVSVAPDGPADEAGLAPGEAPVT